MLKSSKVSKRWRETRGSDSPYWAGAEQHRRHPTARATQEHMRQGRATGGWGGAVRNKTDTATDRILQQASCAQPPHTGAPVPTHPRPGLKLPQPHVDLGLYVPRRGRWVNLVAQIALVGAVLASAAARVGRLRLLLQRGRHAHSVDWPINKLDESHRRRVAHARVGLEHASVAALPIAEAVRQDCATAKERWWARGWGAGAERTRRARKAGGGGVSALVKSLTSSGLVLTYFPA